VGLILDTNALSAIADGESGAVQKFASAAQVAIPVVVLGEYLFGIAKSRHKGEYERWLAEMTDVSRVLNLDEETAVWYAALRIQLKEAGTPIPSNDAWIAALCRQHTLPILSRDRHFDLIKGLKRFDW
jgi:tRNA(fMet)-specific endonuclease VapC